MFLFIIFILSSVIISRYLDKKMSIASIFFTIFFIFINIYMLFMLDIDVVISILKTVIGTKEYEIIREVIYISIINNKVDINIYTIIESIIVILAILVVIIGILKVKKQIEKIIEKKDEIITLLKEVKEAKEIKETKHKEKEVYLKYCKLLN